MMGQWMEDEWKTVDQTQNEKGESDDGLRMEEEGRTDGRGSSIFSTCAYQITRYLFTEVAETNA
jgi:hypothetical protein